jgi:hypothetical protein
MSPPRAPSAYLKSELTRPLPTKDGGTLRTVAEARTYMLALPKDRELSARWQRAAELGRSTPMMRSHSRRVPAW